VHVKDEDGTSQGQVPRWYNAKHRLGMYMLPGEV